ncbi:MAG: cytochrome c family protein [Candidatus Desulfofervidaceae bacterium]|nr:cytochrome c family protein [Candidatus Desulfofervidaceae bacterium]
MFKNWFGWIAGICMLSVALMVGYGFAQDDEMVIAHKEVFKRLERAPVVFNHEKHVEVLGDEACAQCHHVYNEEEGKLVYEEGEETGCADCHGLKDEKMNDGSTKPSLMNAYHISCVKCHRKLAKAGKKTGPYTCGECHVKVNWKLINTEGAHTEGE